MQFSRMQTPVSVSKPMDLTKSATYGHLASAGVKAAVREVRMPPMLAGSNQPVDSLKFLRNQEFARNCACSTTDLRTFGTSSPRSMDSSSCGSSSSGGWAFMDHVTLSLVVALVVEPD